MRPERRRGRFSLALRLTALALLAAAASATAGISAVVVVQDLDAREVVDTRLDANAEGALQLDELVESLRADVYARYSGVDTTDAGAVTDLETLQGAALSLIAEENKDHKIQTGSAAYALSLEARTLLVGPVPRPEAAAAFARSSDSVIELVDKDRASLAVLRAERKVARGRALRRAFIEFAAGTVGSGGLLLGVGLCIRRSLLRSIGTLSTTAARIAAGDLTARTGFTGTDEVGTLGRVFDETADNLTRAIADLDAEADRQDFHSRLARALAQADTEDEVATTVQRALSLIGATLPAELLIADSSEAHLTTMAVTPGVTAPACPVTTPRSCPAARSGRSVRYSSTGALDACPHLVDRPAGDVSAACYPVSFMGKVTGVLHTAAAPGSLPGSLPGTEATAHLEHLAELVGARLGSLKALDQIQRQASLDGLTGLPNRRTFQDAVHRLVGSRRRYGLLIADLDRFKSINDTFGHSAGDQALKRFSDCLRGCVRPEDLLCRYGGEEFVVAVPGTDASGAAEVGQRLRTALAAVVRDAGGPAFTVSVGVSDSTMASTLVDQLSLADAALLAAKRSGRDRVLVSRGGDTVPPGTAGTAGTAGAGQKLSEVPDEAGR